MSRVGKYVEACEERKRRYPKPLILCKYPDKRVLVADLGGLEIVGYGATEIRFQLSSAEVLLLIQWLKDNFEDVP